MVPSARVVNHSGCSVAQGGFGGGGVGRAARVVTRGGCGGAGGWSGAACGGRSAPPWGRGGGAGARKRSKSSGVRGGGGGVWCPPYLLPMAHGEPTSSGVG